MARILIIEDNSQLRIMLSKMLEREGYEVVGAPNGKKGIEINREKPADLIITDILMPEMPGSRVISKLRRECPSLKIIAISGGGSIYGPDDYLNFASKLGAQRAFLKPVRREQLLKAVRELLE